MSVYRTLSYCPNMATVSRSTIKHSHIIYFESVFLDNCVLNRSLNLSYHCLTCLCQELSDIIIYLHILFLSPKLSNSLNLYIETGGSAELFLKQSIANVSITPWIMLITTSITPGYQKKLRSNDIYVTLFFKVKLYKFILFLFKWIIIVVFFHTFWLDDVNASFVSW